MSFFFFSDFSLLFFFTIKGVAKLGAQSMGGAEWDAHSMGVAEWDAESMGIAE